LFHFTRHFRAGLSHAAGYAAESPLITLHILSGQVVLTRSLKPRSFVILNGTAEAVPYPKSIRGLSVLSYKTENLARFAVNRRSWTFFRSESEWSFQGWELTSGN
jgi:hypothetical protein